ncbi:hypothetical protein C2S51_008837 [Perilla frutescens var. frutescens]|nr:hypothetical protein C2S51_008837 [Perilla frutescens var. frutescens]
MEWQTVIVRYGGAWNNSEYEGGDANLVHIPALPLSMSSLIESINYVIEEILLDLKTAPFKPSAASFPTIAVPEERTRRSELRIFTLAGILRQLAVCLRLEARLLSWDFSHLRSLSFELWGERKKSSISAR